MSALSLVSARAGRGGAGIARRAGSTGSRAWRRARRGRARRCPRYAAACGCPSSPVERTLAFPAVEAGDVTAVERQPGDAVAVDVHAADAEAGERHLIDLGERGLRRVRARIEPDHVAGMRQVRAPDRLVRRRIGNRVHAEGDAGVLAVIGRRAGLVIALVALA